MAKKKGQGRVGRWGDSFDGKGNLSKLENVKTVKPSKQWNDPMPAPKFDMLNEICTSDVKIDMNNQIFGGPGRQQGDVVTYEASQYFNYKVAWSRFEKARSLSPSYVHKISEKKYKVGYCTSSSPSRFWEVEVSFGNGTYITLSNPNLTILCPRPFSVSELSQVGTDADSLVWEQLQGRITIISPTSGDGSLNPTISIIGNRTPTDPPILIKVSLPDDPNIFDILAIDTTLTERIKNIATYSRLGYDPQYMITSASIIPYKNNPTGLNLSYLVSIENSSWNIPNTNYKDDYLGITLEQNKTGTWEKVKTVFKNETQKITLELFVHYRIITLYGKHNTPDWYVISPAIYLLRFSPRGIVVDETPLKNISCQNKLKSTFKTDPFAVIIKQEAEQLKNISCQNKLKSTFKTDPLGGIIIG